MYYKIIPACFFSPISMFFAMAHPRAYYAARYYSVVSECFSLKKYGSIGIIISYYEVVITVQSFRTK